MSRDAVLSPGLGVHGCEQYRKCENSFPVAPGYCIKCAEFTKKTGPDWIFVLGVNIAFEWCKVPFFSFFFCCLKHKNKQ